MTEDQHQQFGSLVTSVDALKDALREMRNEWRQNVTHIEERMSKLATKEDLKQFVHEATHRADIERLESRVDAVERGLSEKSIQRFMQRLRDVAVTVTAVAAAVALFVTWAKQP